MTIADIKAANRRAGRFFFSPDTMRFFKSQVSERVYYREGAKYAYFVTSERQVGGPRRWTVRRYNVHNADIITEGKHGAYGSESAALCEARRLSTEVE